MTIVALGLRIVIAVCAQILNHIDPPKPVPGRPSFEEWAAQLADDFDPPLEPWEEDLLEACKAHHPANYCSRCGVTHPQDGPCGRDN